MSIASPEQNSCARLSRGVGLVRCRQQHGQEYCSALARACNMTAAACFAPLLRGSGRPPKSEL